MPRGARRVRTKKGRKEGVVYETDIQSAFITWKTATSELQTDEKLKNKLKWIHCIPNGFYRSPAMQMKAKREGIVSGVLDVFVPSPSGEYHGLYIEFKKPKTGRLSPDQREFKVHVESEGYKAVVYDDWKAAARLVVDWLGLRVFASIHEGDLSEQNA